MDSDDAVELLKAAIPREPGVWADLGAGTGTFTRALASLLPGGRVYAVDQNACSLSKLNNQRQRGAATIIPVVADFTRPLDLPGLGGAELDGLLFANSLHFVADPATALGALAARVRTGGRIVIVEYDRRAASRWVRSEEHTSELQSHVNLVCRLLLEKKKLPLIIHLPARFLPSRPPKI